MKIAIAYFIVYFAATATIFAPPNIGQRQDLAHKLPANINTEGMEKNEGTISNGNLVTSYEIYNKPNSQYYDVIRYKIRRLSFLVFENENKTEEEGVQLIENWQAKMFLFDQKICWKTFLLMVKCESWREIKKQEEKERVARIIGAILKDNLQRIGKLTTHNQDPTH